jgi:hypothetical protein
VQPVAKLVGFVIVVGAAVADEHYAGGGDPGETGKANQLPAHTHRFRSLLGVERHGPASRGSRRNGVDRRHLDVSRQIGRRPCDPSGDHSPVNHVGMVVAIDDLPAALVLRAIGIEMGAAPSEGRYAWRGMTPSA